MGPEVRGVRRGCLIVVLSLLGTTGPASATDLPPGFVEQILVDRLPSPMSTAWGPDGELWIGGKLGHVWVLRGETLIEVARLVVSSDGERGVHGIAVDPDFARNRYVWIYYSPDGPPFRNRLARFRSLGDQLIEETLILETPDLKESFHNGGCVRFAPDGTIFLSTGDDLQNSDTAQNPDDIRGKILHINRDGSPADGNPYLGGGGDPRVWAIGFRNPWRFSLQPGSDNLFIGDVGDNSYEELNVGVPGGNFGWAEVEGPSPPGVPGATYPIYSYPHTSEVGHAIIAGQHASATSFPPEYAGDFFFGDAVTNEIFRMELDEVNQPVAVTVFASDLPTGPVDIGFGPDGALYYVGFGAGRLYRIAFVGGSNRQPVARARTTADSGEAPLTVTFDASDSFDPDGDTLTFAWDFGDGARGSGPVVTHDYAAGAFEASLTVSDSAAHDVVRGIRIVSGNTRPTPVLETRPDGYRYVEGELIEFAGTAFDREEGLVPCRQFVWTVIFHHKGHTHPFLGPVQGCSGLFVIDSHGVEQTFYELRLTVQDTGLPLGDDGKLTGTRAITMFPMDNSKLEPSSGGP